MVNLAAVLLPDEPDEAFVDAAVQQLPEALQPEQRNYVQKMDRVRGTFGKLLIAKVLAPELSPDQSLSGWSTGPYGRPMLPGFPRFNLTHSGNRVAICWSAGQIATPIVSASGRPNSFPGLDVERIRPIDFELFGSYMTEAEWRDIRLSGDPEARFYHYWTAKEAVMKAEGMGFHLPLKDIVIQGKTAWVGTRSFALHQPDLGKGYAAHLACDPALPVGRTEWFSPEDLMRWPDGPANRLST